jgi:hypothetical protein
MSTEVKVDRIPVCDVCNTVPAAYDAKTAGGPWGYLCEGCFARHGVGLGTGRGQRLILRGK